MLEEGIVLGEISPYPTSLYSTPLKLTALKVQFYQIQYTNKYLLDSLVSAECDDGVMGCSAIDDAGGHTRLLVWGLRRPPAPASCSPAPCQGPLRSHLFSAFTVQLHCKSLFTVPKNCHSLFTTKFHKALSILAKRKPVTIKKKKGIIITKSLAPSMMRYINIKIIVNIANITWLLHEHR